MKNTRSKRLLACFLAALGLSMNSMNSADVSAENGQIRENIEFCFGVGAKHKERVRLNKLAGKIHEFIEKEKNGKFIDNNNIEINYSYIASQLYENLKDIVVHRKKYTSELVSNLEKSNLISSYPGDNCNDITEKKKWIKNVAESINNHTVQGGHFTVLDGRIKKILPGLIPKLKEDLENKEKPFTNDNEKDKNLIGDWDKTSKAEIELKSVNNEEPKMLNTMAVINFKLYDNGNLVISEHKPDSGRKLNLILETNILNSLPENVDSKSIKKIIIGENISSIENFAFNGLILKNLKEIEISNSVKNIENQAFFWCKDLTVKIAETHPKLNDIVMQLKSGGIKVEIVKVDTVENV